MSSRRKWKKVAVSFGTGTGKEEEGQHEQHRGAEQKVEPAEQKESTHVHAPPRERRKAQFQAMEKYLTSVEGQQWCDKANVNVYPTLSSMTKQQAQESKLERKTSAASISVLNMDCLEAAAWLQRRVGHEETVGVLDMASSNPRPNRTQFGHGFGGGVAKGAGAQEEQLFLRTSIAAALHNSTATPPVPEEGVVVVENVAILAKPESQHFEPLWKDDPQHITVVMAAALHKPSITRGRYSIAQQNRMRRKMRALLMAFKTHGLRSIVLGAFGCGAYGNPPYEVAGLFHELLMEDVQFQDSFDNIAFAILSRNEKEHRTLSIFHKVFSSSMVSPMLSSQSRAASIRTTLPPHVLGGRVRGKRRGTRSLTKGRDAEDADVEQDRLPQKSVNLFDILTDEGREEGSQLLKQDVMSKPEQNKAKMSVSPPIGFAPVRRVVGRQGGHRGRGRMQGQ